MFRLRNTVTLATRALARIAAKPVARAIHSHTTTKVSNAVTQVRYFSAGEQGKESSFWSDILRGKKNEGKAEEAAQAQQQEQQQHQQQQQQDTQAQAQAQTQAQAETKQQATNGATAAGDVTADAQQQQQPQPEAIDPAAHEKLKADLASSQKEIERLHTVVNEKENKIKELRESLLRELAEQENVRARAAKDVQAARAYGVSSFAKNLLDVVDSLDMAVNAANKSMQENPTNDALKNLLEGVDMTRKLFFKGLESAGIKKFESMGQKVDPNLHFITAQLPAGPEVEPGTITYVIKEGYMIQDRVLRPAQVAIAAKPSQN